MNRRGFLKALGGLSIALAAPAIVHAGNLMPVKPWIATAGPTVSLSYLKNGAPHDRSFATIADALAAVGRAQPETATITLGAGIHDTPSMKVSDGRHLTIQGAPGATVLRATSIDPDAKAWLIAKQHATLTLEGDLTLDLRAIESEMRAVVEWSPAR